MAAVHIAIDSMWLLVGCCVDLVDGSVTLIGIALALPLALALHVFCFRFFSGLFRCVVGFLIVGCGCILHFTGV